LNFRGIVEVYRLPLAVVFNHEILLQYTVNGMPLGVPDERRNEHNVRLRAERSFLGETCIRGLQNGEPKGNECHSELIEESH